jgi:hypothetical protein
MSGEPQTDEHQHPKRTHATLTPFFCSKGCERELTSIYTEKEYTVNIRTMKYACEYIKHGTPCWLYLDADRYYIDAPTADTTNTFYQTCIGEINKLFPGVPCFVMSRLPRRTMHASKLQWKVSYHFTVKAKVMPEHVVPFLKQHGYSDNEPFDFSPYTNGRLLNAPLCIKPKKCPEDDDCPPLKYREHLNVLDHLVTYVPDDEPMYDLAVDMNAVSTRGREKREQKVTKEHGEGKCVTIELLTQVVMGLNVQRAKSHPEWRNVMFGIATTARKNNYIDAGWKILEQFSLQDTTNYDSRRNMAQYDNAVACERVSSDEITFGSLVHYLRQDNPELCEELFHAPRVSDTSGDNLSELIDKCIESNGGHSDVAYVVGNILNGRFVYTGKTWYMFDKHRWKLANEALELRELLSSSHRTG